MSVSLTYAALDRMRALVKDIFKQLYKICTLGSGVQIDDQAIAIEELRKKFTEDLIEFQQGGTSLKLLLTFTCLDTMIGDAVVMFSRTNRTVDRMLPQKLMDMYELLDKHDQGARWSVVYIEKN